MIRKQPDGTHYDGEYKDGQKHGKGIETLPDGTRYDGDWENDEKDGKGTETWPTGERCDGEWENDEEPEQGTETQSAQCFSQEYRYDGEYRYGKKHGQGILKWPSGTSYDG